MTSLLAISIGPVQEFIAAARRTADLSAGSDLLVKLVRAAALSLEDQPGVKLIFPATANQAAANKILAEVSVADPAALASQARQAAQEFLLAEWEKTLGKLSPGVRGRVDDDLARCQVDDLLEWYAAWVSLDGKAYSQARTEVERLLAGRKALRDFGQPRSQANRPKSPLDPSRDSVLKIERSQTVPESCTRGPLRLKQREALDAVSIMKRVQGASRRNVPSTSQMAAECILPELERKAPDVLRRLRQIASSSDGAFDLGDLLFPLAKAEEEAVLDVDLSELARLRHQALASVDRKEAPAYYAVLVADGDRMGKLIDAQESPEGHRTLSGALATFASSAQRVVADHGGAVIYSGGDDVLALLPLNRAIDAACALANRFREALENYSSGQRVSLSAGLAIVHHLEPLQQALEYARNAERHAKEERGALAVALHTRGGGPARSRATWAAAPGWRQWANLFQQGLARGVPYELRELAAEWNAAKMDGNLLPAEVWRVLKRKENGEAALKLLKLNTSALIAADRARASGQKSELFYEVQSADALDALAQMMLVSRFLCSYGFPVKEVAGA